jgi:small subunit ribosomal protein S20
LLIRFGIWKAIVKADAGPRVPKKLAATISRTRPAIRERPVAIEKIAVLRATPPPPGGTGGGGSSAKASAAAAKAAIVRRSAARPGGSLRAWRQRPMANIHSQKKRILRSERERLENRRYTSAIKTYFRRLESLVESGDREAATSTHRELTSTIDKAVKRGALHRNTGARKKSRAARLAATPGESASE